MLSYESKRMFLLVVALATMALQITAVSTEYWAVKDVYDGKSVSAKVNWGLWKMCGDASVQGLNVDKCYDLPPKGDPKEFRKNSLEAARAFAVLGPVLVFLSIFFTHVHSLGGHWQGVLLLMGGLCSLIATVVFAAELRKPFGGAMGGKTAKYGYSYFLSMAGGVMGVLASIVFWKM